MIMEDDSREMTCDIDSYKTEKEAGLDASKEITFAKNYLFGSLLADYQNYGILEPPKELTDIPVQKTVRIFKLKSLVYENKKDILNEIIQFYGSIGIGGFSPFIIIESNGLETNFYLGVKVSEDRLNYASEAKDLLEASIDATFPGSCTENLEKNAINALFDSFEKFGQNGAIASVNISPNKNSEDKENFTQGLERLIEGMEGKEFLALIIANPLSRSELLEMRSGFESIANSLSSLNKQTVSLTIGESNAMQKSLSEQIGKSVSSGISRSESYAETNSVTLSKTKGESNGFSLTGGITKSAAHSVSKSISCDVGKVVGAAIGGCFGGPVGAELGAKIGSGVATVAKSISDTTTQGQSLSGGINGSISSSMSESETKGETKSTGKTTSANSTDSKSSTASQGETFSTNLQKSIQVQYENFSVTEILEKIKMIFNRLNSAEDYGGWRAGSYFIAKTTSDASIAASLFSGILSGENTGAQNKQIAIWNNVSAMHRKNALLWLKQLKHPLFVSFLRSESDQKLFSASNFVTGKELALLCGLPRKSCGAVNVIKMPRYGTQIRSVNGSEKSNLIFDDVESTEKIKIGNIRKFQKNLAAEASISLAELSSHAFITGSTGTGKTSLIINLLNQMIDFKKPFLVIEPVKGEYKRLLSSKKVVTLFPGRNLKLNPFSFPANVRVSEHIDRVVSCFCAAFPMYAAMPQILEEAIYASYEKYGWDTVSSRTLNPNCFPKIQDVCEMVPVVVEKKGFSGQLAGDYVGSLLARLNSFSKGDLGLMLACDYGEETTLDAIFNENVIVDLTNIGSSEKKALITAFILIKLFEFRYSKGLLHDTDLEHLTVIEEAHNLLKPSSDKGMESENSKSNAVEMFAGALAEMRGYGEGFFIVDQSPTSVDVSVVKNTNTKIVLRLPYDDDRKLMGGALSLNDSQTNYLARIENYSAIVFQQNWLEPVQVSFSRPNYSENIITQKLSISSEEVCEKALNRRDVLAWLLNDVLDSCCLFDNGLSYEQVTNIAQTLSDDKSEVSKIKEILGRKHNEASISDSDCKSAFSILLPYTENMIASNLRHGSEQGIINSLILYFEEALNLADPVVITELASYAKNLFNKNQGAE